MWSPALLLAAPTLCLAGLCPTAEAAPRSQQRRKPPASTSRCSASATRCAQAEALRDVGGVDGQEARGVGWQMRRLLRLSGRLPVWAGGRGCSTVLLCCLGRKFACQCACVFTGCAHVCRCIFVCACVYAIDHEQGGACAAHVRRLHLQVYIAPAA